MSQFISISTANLQIFSLLIFLLILTNDYKVSANTIHGLPQSLIFDDDQSKYLFERDNLSYESIDDEIPSSNYLSRVLRSRYISTLPNSYDLRHGVIRFVPYKKRTIPLELQKALYAHGIVGRRR